MVGRIWVVAGWLCGGCMLCGGICKQQAAMQAAADVTATAAKHVRLIPSPSVASHLPCGPHLVKELQQPGLVSGEGASAAECVPDGQCAAHQLVAARGVHWVDAHVGAANANLQGGAAQAEIRTMSRRPPGQPTCHELLPVATGACTLAWMAVSLLKLQPAASSRLPAPAHALSQDIWAAAAQAVAPLTVPSAVKVLAGLYLAVTRRWRGSTGTAQGAPRYTSPRPST